MTRHILSFLMVCVLALTSQSIASAKGAAPAEGKMVLCVGAGVALVYVDANGNPTSAPHYCPDGMLHAVSQAGPFAFPTPDPVLFTILDFVEKTDISFTKSWQLPLSRGPPLPV